VNGAVGLARRASAGGLKYAGARARGPLG
jgi:hypothetical protein